ncbi:protein-export chaperone SecB [Vibrio cholerae]|uniref:protein-export chaperone SecB n=1 Tax=Vibrio cholerae TaxID=666 RepID=UPI0002C16934|nr:protein-export chaperone SecB [Vibrio cholerae]EKF9400107.1 protein-export chaperone SecB [Vibrio cholerae]EMQ52801.1 pretranslocase subunit SecB family protein [Vibrio cholerae O1 str. EM-1676A]NOE51440.1 preprotein translocase subunit SecB [Vibrio cholerae]
MKIQLKNTRVESLNLISNDEITKDEFLLSMANGYPDKELKFFVVKFDIEVKSEHGYELQLGYVAEFETDEDVSTEFKNSQFPIVNAPAIAYPYLRSFVSLLTLNSGYETLVLPTVNFQAMAQKAKAE